MPETRGKDVATADLVLTHDFRGSIVSIRGSVERITGYSREEAAVLSLQDLLEPEFVEQTFQDVMDQIGGGTPAARRIVLRSKSGGRVPLEIHSRLVFDKGRPVAVRGVGWETQTEENEERRESGGAQVAAPLMRYSVHLQHLHRLYARNYGSLDDVFQDFLRTGCDIFDLQSGVVYGASGGRLKVRATHGVTQAEQLATLSDGRSARGGLSAPVIADGNMYGRLSFLAAAGSRRRFTLEERELISLMGRSLGRVISEYQVRAEKGRAARLEVDRNELLGHLASNRPLEATLMDLARMLERQSPGVRAAVLLAGENLLVSRVVAPTLPRLYRRLASRMPIPSHILRDAISTPLRFSAQRLGADFPLDPGILERFHLGAGLCKTIVSGSGQTLGLIALHYPDAQEPRGEDHGLLSIASQLAAIAIEQHELTGRLAFQAHHDAGTGLPNRLALVRHIESSLAEMQPGAALAILFFDLDRFTQVNDALGHPAGDRVLRMVGERLSGLIHPGDFVARVAGDEFAAVLGGFASGEQALHRLPGVIDALRRPYHVDGREVFATASIGVSVFPPDGSDAASLLRYAERAMHQAKRNGRNGWHRFTADADPPNLATLDLENALRHALEKQELQLYYQPIVSMEGRLEGFEALLGWRHPKLGRISPAIFIPLAEEAGLIDEIGTWVLEQVCEQNAKWQACGYAPVKVAANVSALQFARPEFYDAVEGAISKSRLDPQWLVLELTEGVVIRDLEGSARSMARLRELGVRISIDDFGTGYSSLNYLHSLPLDTLKIDRSFLHDLTSPNGSLPVVETIVSLAHNLNLQVIAEGVETQEQLEMLRAARCDSIQGHLYGKPVPAAVAENLLRGADRILLPVE